MSSTLDARRLAMHNKRKRKNVVALTLSLGAMAFGVFWLVWILFETIYLGIGGLNEGHLFPLTQGTGTGVVLLHLPDPVCWIDRHQRPVQGAAVHGAEQGQETVATGRRQRFAAAA